MKALVYEGPKVMNIRDINIPEIGDQEVLIRVAYSGICGSELSGYLGKNAIRKPPLVFGHEFSGTIAALGQGIVSNELIVGTRVTANPLVTCMNCDLCKCGNQQLCRNRKLLSAALPGSNAEYVKLPAQFVYRLPDHMTLQLGALSEPVACAVRAVELASPQPGQTVLIMGMGPIGLLALQVVKLHGWVRVIAVDTNEDRLELARNFGADVTINPQKTNVLEEIHRLTSDRGVHAAIDAVGAGVTREQCIRASTSGGTVVLTGLHEESSALPINLAIRNEIVLLGSFAYSTLNFETAIRLLSEGLVDLGEGIIEAPLEHGVHYYEQLLGPAGRISKVLLQLR